MNLYLRLFLLLLRLIGLPRKGLLEESRVAFRVLPDDCDVNLHMNNGRYLSFMDLGRAGQRQEAKSVTRDQSQNWTRLQVTKAPVTSHRSLLTPI